MGRFSIKDLEKLSGIKAHTIRIWEKRYGLITPCRTTSNIRYYNDQELRRLLNISILVRNGFKISQIAQLSEKEIGEKVLMLSQRSGKPDELLENLIVSIMEYDEETVDLFLLNHIFKYGMEETFIKLIIPLHSRLEILQQTDTLTTTHLRFAYNLIRQRLIVAIDSQRDKSPTSKNKSLLALFEPERNEVLPLFLQYILRKNEMPCLYLGRITSLSDFEKLLQQYHFTNIITTYTFPILTELYQNMINKIAQIYSGEIVIVLFHPIDYSELLSVPNLHFVPSIADYTLLFNKLVQKI